MKKTIKITDCVIKIRSLTLTANEEIEQEKKTKKNSQKVNIVIDLSKDHGAIAYKFIKIKNAHLGKV